MYFSTLYTTYSVSPWHQALPSIPPSLHSPVLYNALYYSYLLFLFRITKPLFLLSYFHDTKNVYLLLEYLSGGELFKKMSKAGGFLSEDVCKVYMKDIAMGLSYLHDRQVMHRDIKPENILIGEDGRLRLTDLGWAVNAPQNGSKIGPNNPGVRYTMCGTPEYLAPEMVAGTGHTLSVDLWALGVLLYEMLYGR